MAKDRLGAVHWPIHLQLPEPGRIDAPFDPYFGNMQYPTSGRGARWAPRTNVSSDQALVRYSRGPDGSRQQRHGFYPRRQPLETGLSSAVVRPPRTSAENPFDSDQNTAPVSITTNAVAVVQQGTVTITLPPHLRKNYESFSLQQQSKGLTPIVGVGADEQRVLESLHAHVHRTVARQGESAGKRSLAELDTIPSTSVSQFPLSLQPNVLPWGTNHPGITDSLHHPSNKCHDRSITTLRYLKHIEQDLTHLSEYAVEESRPGLLGILLPRDQLSLYSNRVAITGALGSGKTYLAMACVSRLIERSERISVFWMLANTRQELEADCQAVAFLLGISLSRLARPWDHFCECIEYLSRGALGRALVIIDGLNDGSVAREDIDRLHDVPTNDLCLVMATTRDLDTAERFAGDEYITLGCFNDGYAANILGLTCSVSESPIFNQIAQAVEYDPYITIRVRDFLRSTDMSVIDYANHLASVFNEDDWIRGGRTASAAKSLWKGKATCFIGAATGNNTALAAVLRSCLNPFWQNLFHLLAEHHPAASELLSKLSVLGLSNIPSFLLTQSASEVDAASVLLNKYYLKRHATGFSCSKLMLIAHRSWLLMKDELGAAYQMALQMVANYYPDTVSQMGRRNISEIEAFAEAVSSATARSWIPMNETTKGNLSMLRLKRNKFIGSVE